MLVDLVSKAFGDCSREDAVFALWTLGVPAVVLGVLALWH
jgi:hypothetical protein